MPALIEEGRAKVNLSLRVVGRRVDGYHDLESVVAFADCADRLTLEPGDELKLTTTGPLADACGELADNLVFKAANLLADAVPGLKLDPRLQQVALATGADVPVCLASRACNMTGVGEMLLPLSVPKMPCVLVNPRIPVATKDVFAALGLRNGELLIGATDVLRSASWPEAGASLEDWVEALAASSNDLEEPATRIQPAIGQVIAALSGTNGAWLARMSGSGATCFAIYENTAEAGRAAEQIRRDHPTWWVHAGTLS
jgi:4-diphosphocytidyl-2-C-methyl-D-erythritol kinase